jgi:3-oxoacyl-(acyl-carrier-protein) synthase III
VGITDDGRASVNRAPAGLAPDHVGPGHAQIVGIGAYRPRRVVANEEAGRPLGHSPEWITRRTGITSRRFAGPDESLVEMGAIAGAKALADAGLAPADVDRVLVATMSDVPSSPLLASQLASRCGIAASACGLSAACAGFTAALAVAAASVRAGSSGACLVVGVERMSDIVDPADQSTAYLFGDGAGAALVTRSRGPGIGPVAWGTRTDLIDAITVRPDKRAGGRPYLRMKGSEVFRWAVTSLPGIIREALERAGLGPGGVQAFVPHQANLRITEAVASAVGFPPSVAIARDIVTQGNTAAASVPLAIDALRASGAVRSGDLAVLAGYGAGLSYAAMVARVP